MAKIPSQLFLHILPIRLTLPIHLFILFLLLPSVSTYAHLSAPMAHLSARISPSSLNCKTAAISFVKKKSWEASLNSVHLQADKDYLLKKMRIVTSNEHYRNEINPENPSQVLHYITNWEVFPEGKIGQHRDYIVKTRLELKKQQPPNKTSYQCLIEDYQIQSPLPNDG